MTIVCMGDSLTQGDYGIPGKSGIANVREENYPRFLAQMTGARVINAGKCGYRASTYLNDYESGQVDVQGADIVVVMLGTNGGLDPETDNAENAAYRRLLDHIAADAPAATVVLCTPPHATENPAYSNCGYAPQVKQAVAFVKKLCAQRSLPMIDLAACPDFGPEHEAEMQPNDGLHYGEKGYRVMARYVADALHRLKLL